MSELDLAAADAAPRAKSGAHATAAGGPLEPRGGVSATSIPKVPSRPPTAFSRPWRGMLAPLVHETWKYFLVSLAALAVDYGLLVGLTSLGRVHYLVSAGVGFCAGLALNYALSVTFVFRERRLADRRVEFIVFMLIGLAGLALNEALMRFFVETAGLGYALAKIPATGVGFVFNFGARRAALFTRFAGVRG